MVNPTEREINEAHSAVDWSQSVCGKRASKLPSIARLFDDPDLNPESAQIAKKLCIQCPILGECLIYALRFETPIDPEAKARPADTLLAGFSLRERMKLKRSEWWAEWYEDSQ